MNVRQSASPSASLHAAARIYKGKSLTNRLMDRISLPQVLEGLKSSSKTMPALTWYDGEKQSQHYSYGELLLQESQLGLAVFHVTLAEVGDAQVTLSLDLLPFHVGRFEIGGVREGDQLVPLFELP